MKILPVGAELFHVEFRDKGTDMVKPTVAFHNFVNMPKTRTARRRARGLVEEMHCKQERRGFASQWYAWNFSLTFPSQSH